MPASQSRFCRTSSAASPSIAVRLDSRIRLPVDHLQCAIDESLVRKLVSSQFPQWDRLAVIPLAHSGGDNRMFRLGEEMVVRLPSAAAYAAQPEKENFWLRRLAPSLPLAIPTCVALGQPAEGYPWRWSILKWIQGESAAPELVADSSTFAAGVAQFLVALQRIDATGGPPPGPHNFYRGGLLTAYDAETKNAVRKLQSRIDADAAIAIWEATAHTVWNGAPVWVHGDISVGNLLSQSGRLTAVIDFGLLGVGDPACDLSIAWTLFRGEARKTFQATLAYDPDTWLRARAWILWKALIVAAGFAPTTAVDYANPWMLVNQMLHQE
jgi:aminoglycoside phosphotransferase (APT) family kinase protein